MCFSAPASFIAGVTLSSIGAVTVTQVQDKRELPFALMPLLFGLQQIAEGFVWLTLQGQFDGCNLVATNAFAFFAYGFWPLYVPFTVWFMEKVFWRRIAQYVTQGAGLIIGGSLLISMFFVPYLSEVRGNSIAYLKEIPFFYEAVALYMVATVVSLLLSSKRFVQFFGVLMALSASFAYWHYSNAFESVWCFFAAILSITICGYFWRKKHRG